MMTESAALWEIEREGDTVSIVVTLAPPWWKLWAPRGRTRLIFNRKEAILFYQTFYKHAHRLMIAEPGEEF